MVTVNTNVAEILEYHRMLDCVYVVVGLVILGIAAYFHRQAGKERLPTFSPSATDAGKLKKKR
jgi:hypothetical protein